VTFKAQGFKSRGMAFIDNARKFLMFSNLLFLGLGILILLFGAVSYDRAKTFEDNATMIKGLNMKVASLLILMAGAATIACSLCGFWGSFKKVAILLKMYAMILFITSVLQLAFGAWLSTVKTDETLRDQWFASDAIQKRESFMAYMDCCGWDAQGDSSFDCVIDDTQNGQTCNSATTKFINANMKPLASAAIAVGVIEIIGIVMSCVIIFKLTNDKDELYDNAFHY